MTQIFDRLIVKYGFKGQGVTQSALMELVKLIRSARTGWKDERTRQQFNLNFLSFFEKIALPVKGFGRLYFSDDPKLIEWKEPRMQKPVSFSDGNRLEKMLSDEAAVVILNDQSEMQHLLLNAGMSAPGRWVCLFRLTPGAAFLFNYKNSAPQARRLVSFLEELLYEMVSLKQETHHVRQQDTRIQKLEKQLVQKEQQLVNVERNLRRRVYEIHNLLEVSNELYSILNLNQLINSALLIIVGQIGCQRSLALLYDNNLRRYSKKYAKGVDNLEIADLELPVDHPVINYFEHNQRAVTMEYLGEQEAFADFAEYLLKRGIEVVAPIVHSERVQGIIGSGQLLSEQKFGKDELDILNILINMISISVSNAQTYEKVKNLSLTDAMTNLNNYRYFEDRLKEEINRGRRNNVPVSLLMLDIDHFKNYNDTLGHQAGDEALRSVGWILKNAVREEDIVNRYGGEEFCVILPGIPRDVIPILGERIRAKIEEYPFYKENVQPGGKLTVSLGGASFPENADNFEDLVYKADQALYKSKSGGRNRLTLYTEDITTVKEQ